MGSRIRFVATISAIALVGGACGSDSDSSMEDIVEDGEVTDGELGYSVAAVVACAADSDVLVMPAADGEEVAADGTDGVTFTVAAESQPVLDECYEQHFRDVALLLVQDR